MERKYEQQRCVHPQDAGKTGVEIDLLTARAGEVRDEVRNEYNEQLAALQIKQAAARQKITELKKTGESAWGDLKSGVELAWSTMGEAIDSARSRFK